MRIRNILLVSLFVSLYGCQPEAPAPKAAVPAAVEPVAAPSEPKQEAESGAGMSETDAMQLAKKSNCLGCHTVDKKMVGPSFKDIAAKYRDDAGAETRLAGIIGKGGRGVWGVMAMPPSPQLSEADRKILAKFVLSLK